MDVGRTAGIVCPEPRLGIDGVAVLEICRSINGHVILHRRIRDVLLVACDVKPLFFVHRHADGFEGKATDILSAHDQIFFWPENLSGESGIGFHAEDIAVFREHVEHFSLAIAG